MTKELKEILQAFKWTFNNMGTPHTSNHFNIPANGIKTLEDLIGTLTIDNEQITKASVDYALKLPKEYPAEWVVAHRKGFESGAKWNQNRFIELDAIIYEQDKQLKTMIYNYYNEHSPQFIPDKTGTETSDFSKKEYKKR